MITAKKFFWSSVAAGLVIGLVGAQLDTFRAWFWLDNMTSPLMSYLRSRDCGRLDVLLRPDCEHAHARATDPAVVAAAAALEREQALMQIAIRAASLPRPGVVTYYTLTRAQPPQRDRQLANADSRPILPRDAARLEEGEGEAGPHLRMTRSVPVVRMN